MDTIIGRRIRLAPAFHNFYKKLEFASKYPKIVRVRWPFGPRLFRQALIQSGFAGVCFTEWISLNNEIDEQETGKFYLLDATG